MTSKTRTLSFILILSAIFSLSIISAQTPVAGKVLVAGKVYDLNYGVNIADANVVITCNNHPLDTKSLNDGTYAVRFESSECILGNTIKVSSEKGALIGSESGTVIACNEANCDEDYFSLINLALKPRQAIQYSHSGSGSSSGTRRVYICGNGKCDSGETQNTCPKDCKIPLLSVSDESANNEDTTQQTGNPETIELTNEQDGKKLFLFGISKDIFSNLFKMPSLFMLIAFIVLIAVLAIILVKLK